MSSESKRYEYKGPIYYCGNKIAEKSNLYTMAKSWKQARNFFLYKVADGDYITRYDIVDHFIKESPINVSDKDVDEIKPVNKCDNCGYQLNDIGDCPVCDYGEYDLIDLEG